MNGGFTAAVRRLTLGLVLAAGWAPVLGARDAFVMLSGGDSPFENNYSQYLQAKAVVAYLEQNYPRESVWVFFGAGNVEGQKPLFGDVRRQVKRDGLTLDSWLPGFLRNNRPARRAEILRALREEILPAVVRGGTLYLFVGDHGTRTRGEDGESVINLWSLERDPQSERGWRSTDDESLGVTELRRVFAQGLGHGRVVFCMTQCHAGGFHYLAVPRQMTPNPTWFTLAPDGAPAGEQPDFPAAAGFTATDEFSAAAGCDPDPDPFGWAGYERFVPENLLGLDLFSLKRTGHGLKSFAEAHVAATLADHTIDNPYSTSEQYLERWATLIETRLAQEPNLTWKTKRQVAAFDRTVNGTLPRGSDRAFRERQALFRRFIDRLTVQNPVVSELLLSGTRRDLEQTIDPGRGRDEPRTRPSNPPSQDSEPRPRQRRGRGGFAESRRLWNEVVRPAWKRALEAQQAPSLPAGALEFERHLLNLEEQGRDFFFGRSRLTEEVFWRSGYSDPATVDRAKAEAVARWGVQRRSGILAWATAAENQDVRAAAEKLLQTRRPGWATSTAENAPQSLTPRISKETAAERTLFYRRVLAAWQFLLAMNERPALARIRELTELERTPLPPAGEKFGN